MPKTSGLMTDREREICSRIRVIREQIKWSQTDFANEVGISRPKLVSVEYGHTPLRYDLAVKISRTFDIQTKWIATGYGHMRPYIPLLWTAGQRENFSENDLLTKVYDFAPGYFEPWPKERNPRTSIRPDFDFWNPVDFYLQHYCYSLKFHDVAASFDFASDIGSFLRRLSKRYIAKGKATRVTRDSKWAAAIVSKLASKKDLTYPATSEILASVKAQLPSLRERLNRATKETGKMSELAEFLSKATGKKVPLASVSRWLSGNREPGGEITLMLLQWVEQQERPK